MEQLLIIEDDEINRFIYERILSTSTRSIDYAFDGQQGIDKVRENSYDLIILDLGLPLISGLEVARLIKEYEADKPVSEQTPIIVITADNSAKTKELALKAGVAQYLTKPFDIIGLQVLVSTYIKERQLS